MSDRYEALIAELHVKRLAIAADHEPHDIPLHPSFKPKGCPNCGHGAEPINRCGPVGDAICDDLGDLLWRVVIDAFPDADAEMWLREGPAELLDWGCGGMSVDTPRQAIAEALQADAFERLGGPHGWPALNPPDEETYADHAHPTDAHQGRGRDGTDPCHR